MTTRSEVNLWRPPSRPGEPPRVAVCPVGSHGVVAAARQFISAVGPSGFIVIKPRLGATNRFDRYDFGEHRANVYQLATQPLEPGKAVLVAAARHQGVLIAEAPFGERTWVLNNVFHRLDVVDACFLRPGTDSRAVCAAAKDGTLILYRDVLRDPDPRTVRHAVTEGVVYWVVCDRGHIFLLTSTALYVLARLGDRAARSVALESFKTPVLKVPLEAVDMSLCGNQRLLLVLPDAVWRVDLGLIDKNVSGGIKGGARQEVGQIPFASKSTRSILTPASRPMAVAV